MEYHEIEKKRYKLVYFTIGFCLLFLIFVMLIINPVSAVSMEEIKHPYLISSLVENNTYVNNSYTNNTIIGTTDHSLLSNLTKYDHIQYTNHTEFITNNTNFQTKGGYLAGYNDFGNYLTVLGYRAGENSSSLQSTFIGAYSGYYNTQNYVSAIGQGAGYQNTGALSSFVGYLSGFQNSGESNIGLGHESASQNSGDKTIGIGLYANNLNSQDNVIAIGYQAGYNNGIANYFEINQNNININPLISGNLLSGVVRFNNYGAGTLQTDGNGVITAISDEKFKTDLSYFNKGIEAVKKINPINFKYKENSGFDTKYTYTGFSAQNLENAIPEAVFSKQDMRYEVKQKGDSTETIEIPIEGSYTKSISDRAIIAVLVNAIKEQQIQINDLNLRINKLEAEKV